MPSDEHRWRAVVVNLIHLWECQRCGKRHPSTDYHRLPKQGCPGR